MEHHLIYIVTLPVYQHQIVHGILNQILMVVATIKIIIIITSIFNHYIGMNIHMKLMHFNRITMDYMRVNQQMAYEIKLQEWKLHC